MSRFVVPPALHNCFPGNPDIAGTLEDVDEAEVWIGEEWVVVIVDEYVTKFSFFCQ
jgi:hypothetical protein